MSLRGGCPFDRLRTILPDEAISRHLKKPVKSGFLPFLEIASGKERPRNDIVLLVGEEVYIFTNPKHLQESMCMSLVRLKFGKYQYSPLCGPRSFTVFIYRPFLLKVNE
jgi:hypothetical protein